MSLFSIRSLSNVVLCSPDLNGLLVIVTFEFKATQIYGTTWYLYRLKVCIACYLVCLVVKLKLQAVCALKLNPLIRVLDFGYLKALYLSLVSLQMNEAEWSIAILPCPVHVLLHFKDLLFEILCDLVSQFYIFWITIIFDIVIITVKPLNINLWLSLKITFICWTVYQELLKGHSRFLFDWIRMWGTQKKLRISLLGSNPSGFALVIHISQI